MIKLDGKTQFVEYEGLPTICYHYGRYGHVEASCPQKAQQQQLVSTSTASPSTLATFPATNLQPPNALETWSREAKTREEQLFGSWMKAPSRGWRNTRSSKKNSDIKPPSNTSDGNRFELLANFANMDKDKEEASIDVNYKEKVPAASSDNGKEKSTIFYSAKSIKEKKPTNTESPRKTPSNTPSKDSIFTSSAYQTTQIPTTLDPSKHTAITLTDKRVALRPVINQPSNIDEPSLPKSNPITRLEKENLDPKPPDRNPSKLGIKLQPNVKIKNLKPRSKEDVGTPSEELTKALAAALGASIPSEDDMDFQEALESRLDDDNGSDRSDMDH